MKRLPLLASLIGVVALSASLTYWAMQWFAPVQRPIAAAPAQLAPAAGIEAAAGLFGGAPVATSNYQLKGVVAAANGRGSAAILAAEGKPAQTLVVGDEVVPGVIVKQIGPRFVLLADGAVVKRVELPLETASVGGMPAQQTAGSGNARTSQTGAPGL